MRSQLLLAGLSMAALGAFFLILQPLLAIPPPMELTPASGPAGTSVNVTASGLPAETRVYLYWYGKQGGNGTYVFLASAVAGPDGRFTGIVAFKAPLSGLGVHNVTLSEAGLGPSANFIPQSEVLGISLFNLTSGTAPAGPTGGFKEPSPLTTWGVLTITAGAVLAGVGAVSKERVGVEPPAGHRFCAYCSAPVPLTAERCPECNGVQPRE